ncbi:hypothetical protein BCV71DRAFT_279253 [Rhizopus microsporus]|uniref:Uncharacterized protein n=1 Tax=Rhizopus microsporus TaxID=58291 RepID=A0A1X0S946_RHIZD|nr:hypothetical protein BCV71DRAFT_279253 [Rhizopus microsporus]
MTLRLQRQSETKGKELKKLLKDPLTTAKSMALKTKTQTKANMYLYLLLTSLPPLNGSESLRSEMVLLLNMKGKRAAPIRRITEEIKRKCKQSNGEPNLFRLTSI